MLGILPNSVLRLFALFLVAISTCLPAKEVDESALKAAYIFNFIRFVKADQTAVAQPPQTLFCHLSDNAVVAQALSTVLQNTALGRNYEVRSFGRDSLPDPQQLSGCAALYYTVEFKPYIKAHLEVLLENHLLLITDGESADRYSVISMFLRDQKLRFCVNLQVAERAKLKVSSKLLHLAYKVKG